MGLHVNCIQFCLVHCSPEYASLGSVYSYCADTSKELEFEQIVKWAMDISKGIVNC